MMRELSVRHCSCAYYQARELTPQTPSAEKASWHVSNCLGGQQSPLERGFPVFRIGSGLARPTRQYQGVCRIGRRISHSRTIGHTLPDRRLDCQSLRTLTRSVANAFKVSFGRCHRLGNSEYAIWVENHVRISTIPASYRKDLR